MSHYLRTPEGALIRLNLPGTKHLYEVETEILGQRGVIEVEANNRNQAARLAGWAGYPVRSVNMTG